MSSKSLSDLLSEKLMAASKIKQEGDNRFSAAKKEAVVMVREEFRKEFLSFVDYLEMPSSAFLAYWESDDQCQKAIRMVFSAGIEGMEKMASLIRDITNWNPPE